MTTLREAREKGEITKFAKERRADPKGDKARFNATLAAMARTSKAVPATSDEPHSGD